MAEVHRIIVGLRGPSGRANDYGTATEGCYIIENDTVIITSLKGEPVRDEISRNWSPAKIQSRLRLA